MGQVKDPSRKKQRERIFLESGEEFTPELEAELAAEAERGYDLSKAKLHILTRPLLPGSPHPDEIRAERRRRADEGLGK
ncbi:MAG TPA: hypothetical protein VJU14_06270 [Solirubrobacterales bacterium]|nr:hypothetical protein [Solirubrobacterales bacterium]